MGRKAKDVLTYHKRKERYYKWVEGKFYYFGPKGPEGGATKEVALAEYLAWKRGRDNPVDVDLMSVRDDPIKLAKGTMKALLDESRSKSEKLAIYDFCMAHLEPSKTRRRPADVPSIAEPVREPPKGLKLSEVLAFWQTVRKPEPQYGRDQSNRFKHLIKSVGDIYLSTLTVEHVRQFMTTMADKHPNNRAAILGAVKAVLNFLLKPKAQTSPGYDQVRQSIPRDLPVLTAMLNVDSDERKEPDDGHKKPFPVPEFKAITGVVDKAEDKRFKAIWLMAVQTGFNLTDFERLVWGKSVIVDSKVPYVTLARLKRGRGNRVIPLHRDAVKALKEYRKTLPKQKQADGQPVFWGIDVYTNWPAKPRALRDEFVAYREQARVGSRRVSSAWLFKHLRNVGPNVRISAGLPVDMTWAFLGHDNHLGEAQKYEYQEPKRLTPLVNAIAKAYFGGNG